MREYNCSVCGGKHKTDLLPPQKCMEYYIGKKQKPWKPCLHPHVVEYLLKDRHRIRFCTKCLYMRTEICDVSFHGSTFTWRFTSGWRPHPALVKAVDNCMETP